MKPERYISSTNGPLEIKGDERDTAILLNGELMQFTYLREIGSTWRYQVARGIQEADLIAENRFRNFVKYGFLNHDALSIQFSDLLQLLAQGEYQIELTYTDKDIYSVEIDEEAQGYYSFDTYGGLVDVIETQSACEEAIVNSYIELIKTKHEPIVILLKTSKSHDTFLIDGHHKWYAYGRLKQKVKCLLITRLDSPEIDTKEALEYLKLGKCNTEYRNWYFDPD